MPEPSPLNLSGGLGAEEFGRSLPGGGVTGMTIRNWARDGLTSAEFIGGAWVIKDPAAARAWCEANRPERMGELRTRASTGKGGSRARAGRPRKNPHDPKWRETSRDGLPFAPGDTNTPHETGEERPGAQTPGAPPVPPHVNPDQAAKLRHQVEGEREYARKLKLENDRKAGDLIVAADVRAAWTRALEVAGQSFDSIVAGAAERVCVRLGLNADQRPAVEAEIRGEVERAKAAAVKAMAAGAPPQRDTAITRNSATSEPGTQDPPSESEPHGEESNSPWAAVGG